MNTQTLLTSAWPVLAVVAASLVSTPSFASSQESRQLASLSAEEAVRWAIQNRPVVAAAQSEVAALETRAQAVRSSAPLRLHFGRGNDEVPGSTDNDLALSQSIDWFGRSRLAGAVADSEANIARANLRQVKLEVQSEVLNLFNQAVASGEKLVIARELVAIATRFRDAAKRRVDTGQAPEVQLLRANIELERATQVLELRGSEALAAISRLAGATGAPNASPAGFFARAGSPEPSFMQRVPRVLALTAELQLLNDRIRQEKISNRPDVELQVRRSPWMDNAQVGLRVQVSVPITDYGRSRRSVEALQMSRRGLEQQREDALRMAAAEFQALQQERNGAERQVSKLEALIRDAEELLRINERGFETGALTLIESLEAARSLREIEEALLDAKFRLATLDVAILKTEGLLLEEGA